MNDPEQQTADELDRIADALADIVTHVVYRTLPGRAAELERAANHIGYPSIADGINRAKTHPTWTEKAEGLREVTARARQLATELRQDVEEDAPRGIGAALTIPQLTADELEALAGEHVALAPAIARELAKRARQLEELSPLALAALMRAEQLAQQRLDRMRRRPRGAHKAEVIAAAELELEQYARAAHIVAENDTNRRKILRKLGPRD